ncbi:KLTH0B10230p [Lachancea thermotolerans CBS 6340]|uniref:KLTH0B10230p n=1 Tax=Lachancea thermotolerans (strain ATCC 56472 / CBS 6340 / NRRL Y-8284) TaxID=559295 RepID=C5DDC9_LACTC|nr:KLTH0B10230p [Lachancea thermotolerans CBS 6340]CAR21790.1 KLTH0B10230p [Lachancea thermotolerans CBS 6340]
MKGERAEEHLIQTPHVDDQNLRLPRDTFPNRFLYEISRHRTFVIAVSSELILYAFSIYRGLTSKDRDIGFLIALFMIVLGSTGIILTGIITICLLNDCGTDPSNTLHFMKEIVAVGLQMEMREWDIIAARMNRVFYLNNSWATPYFFYDGEACHSFFKNYYLKHYSRGEKTSGTNTYGLEEFQPFVDQAVEAYKKSETRMCSPF